MLVNFAGEPLARVSEEVNFALPDHVRSLYRRSIKEMMRTAGVKESSLVGLGVAVPDDLGLVDLPGRPAAYAKWDKIDMSDLFDKPFSLPVFVVPVSLGDSIFVSVGAPPRTICGLTSILSLFGTTSTVASP